MLSNRSSSFILGIKLLSDICFANIFSHSVRFLVTLCSMSFDACKLFYVHIWWLTQPPSHSSSPSFPFLLSITNFQKYQWDMLPPCFKSLLKHHLFRDALFAIHVSAGSLGLSNCLSNCLSSYLERLSNLLNNTQVNSCDSWSRNLRPRLRWYLETLTLKTASLTQRLLIISNLHFKVLNDHPTWMRLLQINMSIPEPMIFSTNLSCHFLVDRITIHPSSFKPEPHPGLPPSFTNPSFFHHVLSHTLNISKSCLFLSILFDQTLNSSLALNWGFESASWQVSLLQSNAVQHILQAAAQGILWKHEF